jgi:hypothetical protein
MFCYRMDSERNDDAVLVWAVRGRPGPVRGGWLVVAALAFGGESGGRAVRVNLLTGTVLIAVGGVSDPGVGGAGANPGQRAAELISELRSMLEPLLAATGGQPALAEQL